jgi:single-strand DNA-binding protein
MNCRCRGIVGSCTVEMRTGGGRRRTHLEQVLRARRIAAMSQENTITLRGFVTAEPKLWQPTPTHTPVTEIRVGSTPRRLNRATGEWEDGATSYYTVKCWRRLAVNVKSSLRKGDMVIIKGKFVTRTWVDDQQRTRMRMHVEADSVGHDLSFGWSHFNRGASTSWGAVREQADGEVARQDLDAMVDARDDGDEPDEGDESRDAGMADFAMADPGIAVSEVADPEMSDAEFERLANGLDAQADIAPTY